MNNYQRAHSPFEDSATQRLRRMGLTTEDGSPERDAMAVFSSIFAGQFLMICATIIRTTRTSRRP